MFYKLEHKSAFSLSYTPLFYSKHLDIVFIYYVDHQHVFLKLQQLCTILCERTYWGFTCEFQNIFSCCCNIALIKAKQRCCTSKAKSISGITVGLRRTKSNVILQHQASPLCFFPLLSFERSLHCHCHLNPLAL